MKNCKAVVPNPTGRHATPFAEASLTAFSLPSKNRTHNLLCRSTAFPLGIHILSTEIHRRDPSVCNTSAQAVECSPKSEPDSPILRALQAGVLFVLWASVTGNSAHLFRLLFRSLKIYVGTEGLTHTRQGHPQIRWINLGILQEAFFRLSLGAAGNDASRLPFPPQSGSVSARNGRVCLLVDRFSAVPFISRIGGFAPENRLAGLRLNHLALLAIGSTR